MKTATLVFTYKQDVEIKVADDCTPKQLLAQLVGKFDQFGLDATMTIDNVEETTWKHQS